MGQCEVMSGAGVNNTWSGNWDPNKLICTVVNQLHQECSGATLQLLPALRRSQNVFMSLRSSEMNLTSSFVFFCFKKKKKSIPTGKVKHKSQSNNLKVGTFRWNDVMRMEPSWWERWSLSLMSYIKKIDPGQVGAGYLWDMKYASTFLSCPTAHESYTHMHSRITKTVAQYKPINLEKNIK